MEDMVNNPDLGDNMHHIRTSFGENPNLSQIKNNLRKMKSGTIKVKSAIPEKYDSHGNEQDGLYAAVVPKPGSVTRNARIQYEHMEFGPKFFNANTGIDEQAGTLIHEASHFLAGTEDDIIVSAEPGRPSRIYQPLHGMGEGRELRAEMGCE